MRSSIIALSLSVALGASLASAQAAVQASGSLTVGGAVAPQPANYPPPPQAGYVQPGYPQTGYVQPGYAQPVYGQPMYGQPMYGQPVMMARPTEVPYSGGAVPPGATIVNRTNSGLVVPGVVMFSTSYGISLFAGLAGVFISPYACRNSGSVDCGLEWLFVPVLGPWIAMGFNRTPQGYSILAIDGIIQGAGFGLLLAGALTPRKFLLMPTMGSRNAPIQMAILPGGPMGSAGASLAGTF